MVKSIFRFLLLSCAATRTLAFDCTTAAVSAVLPANATALFAIPVHENGTFGQAGDIAYPKNGTNLPPLCAVSVNVTSSNTSSFTFGIFLPTNWNGRFLAVGNGGFSGGINWLEMGNGVRYGFAVVSTNTGHNGSNGDSTFALGNPEAKKDWGYRAMHGSIVLAKEITSSFYNGTSPAFSYYSGCSTGGFQGLKEVQMFPNDFDGVMVGAPAWWHSHLQPWSIQVGLYNQPVNSSHYIPATLFPVIAAEVLRQCDGSDGVVDGIISDPRACDFRPEALLCTPSTKNMSACLTYPQIDTLYKVHSDWVDVNQTFVFPRLELGTENQWPLLSENPPDPLSVGYVQNFVLDDPSWNWTDFSYQTVVEAETVDPGMSDASEFDISAFHGNGGKLLHYHGYADGYIPTHSSVYYYNHVFGTLAPRNISLDDWYRLFLIPGMGHCSGTAVNAPWYIAGNGQGTTFGNGTYSVPGFADAEHDALMALVRWVEKDVAPETIVATKYRNDSDLSAGVLRQRPLCPYPSRAMYAGHGDVNEADNWHCA